MCRITVNGKQSAFSTKLDISSTNWDLKYGGLLCKSREAQDTNSKLDKIRSRIEECYSKILKDEGAVNSAKLKNTFLGMESGELTFFKFYEQFLSDYEKKVNSGLLVNGTRTKYKTLLNHLGNFVLTKYGYSDVSVNDLTSDFVQDFDYYLRDEQSFTHNTIWFYMIGFTTLCRLAMSRKHLTFNPFSEYKNTKKDKDRAYLLRNELEQLITFNCDKKKMNWLKTCLFTVALQGFPIIPLPFTVALVFLTKYDTVFFILGLSALFFFKTTRDALIKHKFWWNIIAFIVIISPNIIWQYLNDFPVLKMFLRLYETQLDNHAIADPAQVF